MMASLDKEGMMSGLMQQMMVQKVVDSVGCKRNRGVGVRAILIPSGEPH